MKHALVMLTIIVAVTVVAPGAADAIPASAVAKVAEGESVSE